MSTRSLTQVITLSLSAMALASHRATAQSDILDRVRKAASDAATAGRKAATDEVNRQISAAVEDVAAADVADGSFSAVLTPWSSSDGAKEVQLARFSGSAFVATTGTGRQVILCDATGLTPWQATFAVANAAPGGARGARGGGAPGSAAAGTSTGGGRGAGSSSGAGSRGQGSGRGAGAGTASGRGASGGASGSGGSGSGRGAGAGGGGRAGSAAGAGSDSATSSRGAGPSASQAPSADAETIRVPSARVTLTLPSTGARSGAPNQGTLELADMSETILAGTAKIRFAQATIPGEKTPQVVDFGVAFKARAMAAGQAPPGCLSPTATAASGRSGASAGRAASAPSGMPVPQRGGQSVNAATPAASVVPAPGANPPAFAEGDIVLAKIDSVKLYADASDSARVVTRVNKKDELVYLGEDRNGYAHVQGAGGDGWIRKLLLAKRP